MCPRTRLRCAKPSDGTVRYWPSQTHSILCCDATADTHPTCLLSLDLTVQLCGDFGKYWSVTSTNCIYAGWYKSSSSVDCTLLPFVPDDSTDQHQYKAGTRSFLCVYTVGETSARVSATTETPAPASAVARLSALRAMPSFIRIPILILIFWQNYMQNTYTWFHFISFHFISFHCDFFRLHHVLIPYPLIPPTPFTLSSFLVPSLCSYLNPLTSYPSGSLNWPVSNYHPFPCSACQSTWNSPYWNSYHQLSIHVKTFPYKYLTPPRLTTFFPLAQTTGCPAHLPFSFHFISFSFHFVSFQPSGL